MAGFSKTFPNVAKKTNSCNRHSEKWMPFLSACECANHTVAEGQLWGKKKNGLEPMIHFIKTDIPKYTCTNTRALHSDTRRRDLNYTLRLIPQGIGAVSHKNTQMIMKRDKYLILNCLSSVIVGAT